MHRWAVAREEALKQQVEQLEAKLRLRERQLFARRSERGSKGAEQKSGAKESSSRKRGQRKGGKGHGRRRHDGLPSHVENRDLPADERFCGCCGLPLRRLSSTEDSEQVEVEVRAHRRVIRRQRYERTCACPGLPRTITAPKPPKLIPKGAYGISFWVFVLLDKFLFQRPTYRLLTDLRLTLGLDVSQGTVTGGLERLAPLFEPLFEAIVARNVSEDRWHADETRWEVFADVEGKVGHRWYLWVFRSVSTVVFRLAPSRSAKVPKDHFGEEARGILNVDRYSAYKTMLPDGRILLAFCWAHVRRDFLAVANGWPKQEGWALAWVNRIGGLYRVNAERLAVQGEPASFAEAQQTLVAEVAGMKKEQDEQLADPKLYSACRKVLESLKRHESGLFLFVENPEVPMDNSQAERDLRGPVVGRKNYYGSGSVWSGQLTAWLFTLLQTLLLWKLNPRHWLTAYLQACADHGGKAPPEPEQWLPWNLDEPKRQLLSEPALSWEDTS